VRLAGPRIRQSRCRRGRRLQWSDVRTHSVVSEPTGKSAAQSPCARSKAGQRRWQAVSSRAPRRCPPRRCLAPSRSPSRCILALFTGGTRDRAHSRRPVGQGLRSDVPASTSPGSSPPERVPERSRSRLGDGHHETESSGTESVPGWRTERAARRMTLQRARARRRSHGAHAGVAGFPGALGVTRAFRTERLPGNASADPGVDGTVRPSDAVAPVARVRKHRDDWLDARLATRRERGDSERCDDERRHSPSHRERAPRPDDHDTPASRGHLPSPEQSSELPERTSGSRWRRPDRSEARPGSTASGSQSLATTPTRDIPGAPEVAQAATPTATPPPPSCRRPPGATGSRKHEGRVPFREPGPCASEAAQVIAAASTPSRPRGAPSTPRPACAGTRGSRPRPRAAAPSSTGRPSGRGC
jgi:hypothetical protein